MSQSPPNTLKESKFVETVRERMRRLVRVTRTEYPMSVGYVDAY